MTGSHSFLQSLIEEIRQVCTISKRGEANFHTVDKKNTH